MNLGELFVNLGVKGSEKAVSAVGNLSKALDNSALNALKAKIGVAALMYTATRLAEHAGDTGVRIQNLATLTGASTKYLQQFEQAAVRVGASVGEADSAIYNMTKTVADMKYGDKIPKGLGEISKALGLDNDAWQTMRGNSEKIFETLQRFAQLKDVDKYLKQELLSDFGLGQNILAAMMDNRLTPDMISKQKFLTKGEVQQNAKGQEAIRDLKETTMMELDRMMASPEVIKMIGRIKKNMVEFIRILQRFAKLLDNSAISGAMDKLSEVVNVFLKGILGVISVFTKVTDALNLTNTSDAERKEVDKNIEDFTKSRESLGDSITRKIFGDKGVDASRKMDEIMKKHQQIKGKSIWENLTTPKAPNDKVGANTIINQTLQFAHEGKEAPRIAQASALGVKTAFKQVMVG